MEENKRPPYTTEQAMKVLGLKSRSAFHYLRKHYPEAFLIYEFGSGRNHPTTYFADEIDRFAYWRNQYKG